MPSWAAVLWGLLAAVWLLDALRLRARARALGRLDRAAPAPLPDPPGRAEPLIIARAGVTVDEGTRCAAAQHLAAHGLEVLDLVPPHLPAARAFYLLQCVDFARFRADRFARGFSAGDALVVDAALAARMGLTGAAPPDALAMTRLAQRLKLYAPLTMAFALAPSLSAPPARPALGREHLAYAFGELALALMRVQALLAWIGPLVAGPAGVVALAVLHLQLTLAAGGTALAPRGLLVELLLRTARDVLRTFQREAPAAPPDPARRAEYAAAVAGGLERFFEPRRADCPLCASAALTRVLEVPDLFQRKPGRFSVDRCADCGHLFQNPRLSLAGLDYYYRDFYDGLGEAGLELIFAATAESYLARVRAVLAVAEGRPARWLDVGTGHGHFAHAARELLADTTFDGVDLAASVEEAARRRWLDTAHRGLFPDLAPILSRAPYDVVSMSHYLEHTRDVRAELAAAAEVLRPGGLLMIEVPDPESKFRALVGRYWLPWFQPQHQHFVPAARLEALLGEHGFEVALWHRGEAHQPSDFFLAAGLWVHDLGPPADVPWRPAPGPLARVRTTAVWVAAVPLLFAARLADLAVTPWARRPGWANTMRVVARKIRA